MKKLLVSFLCLFIFLTGCASKTAALSTESYYYADNDMAYESVGVTSDFAASVNYSKGTTVTATNAKLIKTVWIDGETENYDDDFAMILKQLDKVGGYVESQNSTNYSNVRYTSFTLRVPSDQLDEFIENVQGSFSITSYQENTEDVTLNYTDIESHIASLNKEEERMMEMMDQAETVADLLAIEEQLAEVRYELEYYKSQQLVMDNQIDYSTVYLNLDEVVHYTTVKRTFFERVSSGLQEKTAQFFEDAEDLAVGLIINLPYLIFFGLILFVIVKVVKKILKTKKK